MSCPPRLAAALGGWGDAKTCRHLLLTAQRSQTPSPVPGWVPKPAPGPWHPRVRGKVAASPSFPPGRISQVCLPHATDQALLGSAASSHSSTASRHRVGGTCSSTSSLLGGGPQKTSALVTDSPAKGTSGRAAWLDPLPKMKPRHHLLRLLITSAAERAGRRGHVAMGGFEPRGEWGDNRRRGQGCPQAPRAPACKHPAPLPASTLHPSTHLCPPLWTCSCSAPKLCAGLGSPKRVGAPGGFLGGISKHPWC